MKKLAEVPARSANASRPLGVAMTLDELGTDTRSQSVAESLERVMPAAPSPQAPVAAIASTVSKSISSAITSASPLTASRTSMLSTPIAKEKKKRVNQLRLDHEISTSFVIEIALTKFFADRSNEAVADELRSLGGRLRRVKS